MSAPSYDGSVGILIEVPINIIIIMEWVVREGVGAGGRNDPSLVCTYE
jgi:hypothetical protein